MIRAIVFDCFGVLANDGWLPFKRKHFGDRQELFDQASELNRQVDSGRIGYEEFIPAVAKLADVPVDEARREIENNPADAELFAFIKAELKPSYKIGLLSNAGADWLSDLFAPDQIKLFDAVALSYETGIIKPEPKAYHTIAERLGVELEECVLIDDQERYCTAAQDCGMKAVHYHDVLQLKRDLRALLKKQA